MEPALRDRDRELGAAWGTAPQPRQPPQTVLHLKPPNQLDGLDVSGTTPLGVGPAASAGAAVTKDNLLTQLRRFDMPGMNGTGPYGTGPVGRGMGPCGGGGMGRRSGRGLGRNRGRGWAFEPVEEKTTLEREKNWLEAQLQAITEQLQALEKNNPEE